MVLETISSRNSNRDQGDEQDAKKPTSNPPLFTKYKNDGLRVANFLVPGFETRATS
jgi:hypothetical protein